MLRRQTAQKIDPTPAPATTTPFPQSFPPTDRRRTERRGMDTLRAEALKTIVTMVEDRNFGGLRDRVGRPRNIRFSRILLIFVALTAGGIAAFLALQKEPAPPPPPAAVEVPVPLPQVLVAASTIEPGHRITADALAWQEWPRDTVRPEFMVMSATPTAITDMVGSVARAQIVAGEPIRADKLVPPGTGYLAAVLDKGMRAVSVSIAPESASGGFVSPGDHVDLVLTRTTEMGQQSEILLRDMQVLAIDAKLGEPADTETTASVAFSANAIATLAADPTEAEVILNATSLGKLTLMLRSAADTPAADRSAIAANAAIRMTSPFWTGGGNAAGSR